MTESSNILMNVLGSVRESEPENAKLQADGVSDPPTVSSTDSSTSMDDRRSETLESGDCHSIENQHQQQELEQQQKMFALSQLARQLEYYFSHQNLSKDTYLQTLRELNDGCVPATILANFAKVKAILTYADEELRIAAIVQAATEFSEFLEVVAFDTVTGKPAVQEEDDGRRRSSKTKVILTIGPVGKEPLSLGIPRSPGVGSPKSPLSNPANSSTSTLSPVNNTIILRDVKTEVTEECVREAFDFEGCPPIQSVRPDVANCWYVSLDATSRDDMIHVMLQLRSKSLAGETIYARLKSVTSASAVFSSSDMANAPLLPTWSGQQFHPSGTPPPIPTANKKKKKKTRPSKKGKNKNNGNSNKKNTTSNEKSTTNTIPKEKKTLPPPPNMCEQNFPVLHENKVEWETSRPVEREEEDDKDSISDKSDEKEEGDDGEVKFEKSLSDGASTATTTSTSTDSNSSSKKGAPILTKVGYAAALLKNKNPEPLQTAPKGTSERTSNNSNEVVEEERPQGAVSTTDGKGCTDSEPAASVANKQQAKTSDSSDMDFPSPAKFEVTPPSWGRRSFAEILRQEQQQAATAKSSQ